MEGVEVTGDSLHENRVAESTPPHPGSSSAHPPELNEEAEFEKALRQMFPSVARLMINDISQCYQFDYGDLHKLWLAARRLAVPELQKLQADRAEQARGWKEAFKIAIQHQDARAAAEAEVLRLQLAEENLADYAKRFFNLFEQYRRAWLREMGGVIVPKHWEIDGFVLRAREIYEKAQLVDRIKQVMLKKIKAKKKCTGMELFDEVFKFLAEDKHDQIPTN